MMLNTNFNVHRSVSLKKFAPPYFSTHVKPFQPCSAIQKLHACCSNRTAAKFWEILLWRQQKRPTYSNRMWQWRGSKEKNWRGPLLTDTAESWRLLKEPLRTVQYLIGFLKTPLRFFQCPKDVLKVFAEPWSFLMKFPESWRVLYGKTGFLSFLKEHRAFIKIFTIEWTQ